MTPAGSHAHSSFDNRVFKYKHHLGDGMGKRILTGSFVALITPFADDGSVDIEGFGKLIEFQALNGTSAVLIMGSTGEVSLLSKEERHRVIAETVTFKRFGLPLFYGCTANNTREDLIGEDAAGAPNTRPAAVTPQTGPGGRFLR